MDQFKKTVLPNGVRVLTEHLPHVGSAAIGIWCTTGSVHEEPGEAGITHFIEHMLFKGTKSRTSQQIAEEIEGRGGILNAFTDKERTCYYCRTLADDAENGLDVLADMVANSLLDADELEREKGVVLEEIKRGEDEPGDNVHDLHIQGLWPDHELGLPIIGTSESVSGFKRDDLTRYIERRYTGSHLLVTATGKVDHDQFVRWASRELEHFEGTKSEQTFDRPQPHGGLNYIAKDVEQVHFCIGTRGVSYHDQDEMYTLIVLDAILGGGMSSRLFQEVREKRGLAYAVGSYMLTYTAGGAFTVYGGTGAKTWNEVQGVVRQELDKIMRDGPTETELAKVKRQISGNIVLGLESTNSRMMRMAKNEIVYGRQIPIEETVARIDAVTAGNVIEIARRIFPEENIRTTAIGPAL